MSKLTYTELQKELTHKTKSEENLKNRVVTLRGEVLRYKEVANKLPIQYERIIKEYRHTLNKFVDNSWKLVFLIVIGKINDKWNSFRRR